MWFSSAPLPFGGGCCERPERRWVTASIVTTCSTLATLSGKFLIIADRRHHQPTPSAARCLKCLVDVVRCNCTSIVTSRSWLEGVRLFV